MRRRTTSDSSDDARVMPLGGSGASGAPLAAVTTNRQPGKLSSGPADQVCHGKNLSDTGGQGGGYSFGSCTLHVRRIPNGLQDKPAQLKKVFNRRLQGHGCRYISSCIRQHSKTEEVLQNAGNVNKIEAGRMVQTTTWALVTLSSVHGVQVCLTQPVHVHDPSTGDRQLLHIERVEVERATESRGQFAQAWRQAKTLAAIEIGRVANSAARKFSTKFGRGRFASSQQGGGGLQSLAISANKAAKVRPHGFSLSCLHDISMATAHPACCTTP
jgi:hypothetical protein